MLFNGFMREVCRCAVLILAATLLGSAAAKPKLPKTVPARRLDALLYAFNIGDKDQIIDFIKTNYSGNALLQRPAEERAATYIRLRQDTGGFDVKRVIDSTDHSITVLVQARKTEEWYRIVCPVELVSPHNIVAVVFKLIPRPEEFGGGRRYNDQQIAAELERYVSKLANEHMFSGVVMWSRVPPNCPPDSDCQAQTLFQKAISPPGANHPYEMTTQFGLASISKIFTAIAIAQLREKKKIGFLDPVSKYLPDFSKPRGDRITIHQLLTHTAGLEPFLTPGALADMKRARITTVGDLSRFFGSRTAVGAPGEKFVYSNADYMLLQAIVQVVTGEPFEEYVREHVFEPAGMKSTGNGSSTAPDMTRFGVALLTYKLLPPDATKFLMGGKVPTDDPDTMYAYGLQTETVNGVRVVGHAGGGPGISDQFEVYPDLRYILVVLSSQEDAAQHVSNKVREMLCVPKK
jgi:hypothetical protein